MIDVLIGGAMNNIIEFETHLKRKHLRDAVSDMHSFVSSLDVDIDTKELMLEYFVNKIKLRMLQKRLEESEQGE